MLRTVHVLAVAACLLVAACSSTTSGDGSPGTAPASGGPGSSGSASMSQASSPPAAPGALPAATAIQGVTYKAENNRDHQNGTLKYDSSPPVGGAHAPVWADCTGTVYPQAIADENAVHSLEHGALWITYRPGLPADQLAALTNLVSGQDRLFLSPYPGLQSAISLQSWGYQLRVDTAADPRIGSFVDLLRYNPDTTPEYGATCSNPDFKAQPSTPGNPTDG